MPLEPITPEQSLTITKQSCGRMIASGDAMVRCGGVLWPDRRNDLVCMLATDPLLSDLDRQVLRAGSDATEADALFPDLQDEERITQVALQNAILEHVCGVSVRLSTCIRCCCRVLWFSAAQVHVLSAIRWPQDFHGRKGTMFALLRKLSGLAYQESLRQSPPASVDDEGNPVYDQSVEDEYHIASPSLRYDALLMAWVQNVHDTLPPSDKALTEIAEELPTLTVGFIEAVRA